jgi:hypothetical protein
VLDTQVLIQAIIQPMAKLIRDNGLTIVLLLLFAVSLIGQSLTGRAKYNEDQRDHGKTALTYTEYLQSAAFVESVFENWESEFLQMALYVWLTSFLYQIGSSESKDPDKSEEVDEEPEAHRTDAEVPYPVRAGGLLLKLYENSLSLSLTILFAISFVLHLLGSQKEACREQLLHGGTCSSALQHLGSSTFWFESFQNWQSEFLSIAVIVVLSIFLRQKGSPESKPVHAAYSQTGK